MLEPMFVDRVYEDPSFSCLMSQSSISNITLCRLVTRQCNPGLWAIYTVADTDTDTATHISFKTSYMAYTLDIKVYVFLT